MASKRRTTITGTYQLGLKAHDHYHWYHYHWYLPAWPQSARPLPLVPSSLDSQHRTTTTGTYQLGLKAHDHYHWYLPAWPQSARPLPLVPTSLASKRRITTMVHASLASKRRTTTTGTYQLGLKVQEHYHWYHYHWYLPAWIHSTGPLPLVPTSLASKRTTTTTGTYQLGLKAQDHYHGTCQLGLKAHDHYHWYLPAWPQSAGSLHWYHYHWYLPAWPQSAGSLPLVPTSLASKRRITSTGTYQLGLKAQDLEVVLHEFDQVLVGRLLNQLQAGLHGVLQEAIAVVGWDFLHTRQQGCLLTLLALLFVGCCGFFFLIAL